MKQPGPGGSAGASLIQIGLRAQSQLLEQRDGLRAFVGRETRGGALHRGFMIGERAADQLFAGLSEMHDSRAAVAWVIATFDEPLGFHPIDGGGDGSAGEVDHLADRVHWRRSFVEDDFEDGEIGKSKAERPDVTKGVTTQRFVGLPQHKP